MSEHDEQRFVTPEFTANYTYLDEKKKPQAQSDGGGTQAPYWCVTMKLPKDHPFWDELEEKIETALENKFDKTPKKWRNPVKDGDEMEDESFHDHFFIEMKSNTRKPGVKVYNPDGANEDVVDFGEEIYSGMLCVCTARTGGYDNVSKGVGVYLNNVLKIADGERIGGSTASAEDDFEDYVTGGGAKSKKIKKSKGKKKKRVKSNPLE